MRENGEPARKKTETGNKAEAGRKCMPGRRVEEPVKSNEATKATRGSQRPSKGRARGRGHSRHTASTTPHQDTGEGSTRGTREERHHAPRHARHRHHTHRTHPTSPSSPPSGRAVGGGTAPDLRRPSQWWKAPPPGTPFRHPHSEQRRPARAHAVGPVLGPHAPHRPHPGHTGRGTQAARSRGQAAGGGTAPDTRRPSQRWQATPPGDGPPPPPRHADPTGHAGQGDSVGPPQAHTRALSTWVADHNSPPSGRAVGGGTAPGPRRPSQWWKAPLPRTPFRHPHSEQRRPARAHAVGPVLGPHARTDRTRDTRVAEPWLPAPEDGRSGEGQHLTPGAPHNGGSPTPPLETAPPHPRGMQPPQGMQATGTLLGSHTHAPAPTTRGWRTPTVRPVGGQSGEGRRLASDAPHNGGRHPPGDALPPPPQRATPARKGARCGAGAGSPRPHRPHPGHTGRGTLAARSRGRAVGGGTAPDTRRPSQRWQANPPPETAPHHPRGMQPPQGMQAAGTLLGSHTHTPAPTTLGWRTPTARPVGGQSGEGRRLASDAPHNGGRHPPGDALPPAPQRATPARKGARCGAGAGFPRPHRPHPGHTGRGTLAARPRGRAAGGGTAPDTRRPSQRWQATPPGDGPPTPPRQAALTGHAGQGDGVGPPHPHTRAHSTWVADPNRPPSGRAVGGGTAPDFRRPSQWWKAPPPGTPFCQPHSE